MLGRTHVMRLSTLTLAVVVSVVGATPPIAHADGRREHVRSEFHGSGRFDGHHDHGFRHRAPFPIVITPPFFYSDLSAPTTAYATPAPVYAPPVYAAPPAYAPPPYGASGYGAPMQRVVEFPTGRYELRGDGTYSPYTWVWIPNPPAAPPEPVIPPAPTAPPPEPPRRAPATSRVYRWTDERGVTTWTDSLEKVPSRYRAHAAQLTP
jgi:hypothetical protein